MSTAVLAVLFVHPLALAPEVRLWMLLPLAACVAVVYRGVRAERPSQIAAASALTFIHIVAGMTLIALAFYAAHWAAIRFL